MKSRSGMDGIFQKNLLCGQCVQRKISPLMKCEGHAGMNQDLPPGDDSGIFAGEDLDPSKKMTAPSHLCYHNRAGRGLMQYAEGSQLPRCRRRWRRTAPGALTLPDERRAYQGQRPLRTS